MMNDSHEDFPVDDRDDREEWELDQLAQDREGDDLDEDSDVSDEEYEVLEEDERAAEQDDFEDDD